VTVPGGPAEALARLDEITRRLRVECPWDREQDERSIVPHTVEEAYELADAAARGDDSKLLDELGDVLFQVYFLALLLEEREAGSLTEVAEGIIAKLIRRHPHVFGDADAETSGEVLANWDRIKREQEGRGDGEPFADVPENLPALLEARSLQRRAASAGLGGDDVHREALERVHETLDRLGAVAPEGATAGPTAEPELREAIEASLGDALFVLVDIARILRVDPELALRASAERFRDGAE
jgi:MazG family protein